METRPLDMVVGIVLWAALTALALASGLAIFLYLGVGVIVVQVIGGAALRRQ